MLLEGFEFSHDAWAKIIITGIAASLTHTNRGCETAKLSARSLS